MKYDLGFSSRIKATFFSENWEGNLMTWGRVGKEVFILFYWLCFGVFEKRQGVGLGKLLMERNRMDKSRRAGLRMGCFGVFDWFRFIEITHP